jgi:endonuclease/exonuclease/phosphatase family metal-dependent hydrolase
VYLRALRPEVVTLNEVCRADVTTLAAALSTKAHVVAAFRPALDQETNAPVLCRNGQQYGIGLIARAAAGPVYGGTYPMQDPRDVEARVWLCVRSGRYVCSTHLSSTSPTIALAQCRYLLTRQLPALFGAHGSDPVVVGGDFNLESGRSPDATSCVPSGYAHADDGARQHVLAAGGWTVASVRTLDMKGTTDHPGLLVDLRAD